MKFYGKCLYRLLDSFFFLIGILNSLGKRFNAIYVTVLVFTVAKYYDLKVSSVVVNKCIKKESHGKGE